MGTPIGDAGFRSRSLVGIAVGFYLPNSEHISALYSSGITVVVVVVVI